jgi:hypothetical protein
MVVLCSDPGAAKLSLGLCKPHLRVLNPKIWELDGVMSNGCGGGGLSGERGGDCGCDLRLKCRGGGGISHPKINKNCGLELEQAVVTVAAAAAENEN